MRKSEIEITEQFRTYNAITLILKLAWVRYCDGYNCEVLDGYNCEVLDCKSEGR